MEFEDPKNRYALSEVLHSSSRVRTYRGVNPESGEPVTVKILTIREQDPQGILGRVFLDRSMILSRLEHPSLPVLLEAGLTREGDAFLVFDWVDGQPVSAAGPFPPARALPLMVQVLEGLECLALHNLVHWNITPDNLILNDEDQLRLVGIGASLLPMDWWPTYLESQPVSNTFIAPELRRLGVSPSSAVGGAWWRGDLYSVAMVTCTLLGARVDGAGTAAPKVETLPGVRTALHDLLEQCLLEDPNERPISFSEVIKTFQHVLPRDRSRNGEDVRSTHSYHLRNVQDRRSRRPRGAEVMGGAEQHAPSMAQVPSEVATVEADPDITQKVRSVLEPLDRGSARGLDQEPQSASSATVELDPASVARQIRSAANPSPQSPTPPGPASPGPASRDSLPQRPVPANEEEQKRQQARARYLADTQSQAASSASEPAGGRVAARGQAPVPPERLRGSGEAPTLIETIRQSIRAFMPGGDLEPRADLLEDVEEFEGARDTDTFSVSSLTGTPGVSLPPPPPGAATVEDLAAPVRTPSSGSAPDPGSSAVPTTPPAGAGASGRRRLPLLVAAVVAAALVVLVVTRLLPGGRQEREEPQLIHVSDHSAEPTVEVGPVIEAAVAPPPFVELPPEIEQAINSFGNGDIGAARNLLAPLREQERQGLLAPEVCDVLKPLAESVDLAWVRTLLDEMSRAMADDDVVALRRALNSLSANDLRTARLMSGGQTLLESSDRVLGQIDEVESLLKDGQFDQALESAVALHERHGGMERQANLRERAAMGIERRVDSLNQAGRHDDARAALARLESLWPDRGGLADRKASVERSEKSNDLYQQMLIDAEATIESGRPHEGLATLQDAQPPYALVQEFARLEERLQQELTRADLEAPSLKEDPTRPADFRKGDPFTVTLIARDDYEVSSVEAFVRVEGESEFRSLPVTPVGNERFTFEVAADLHRDRPVEYYATVRDRSGHETVLASPNEPVLLKRKRWFRN